MRLVMKDPVETRMSKMLAIKYGNNTSTADSKASPDNASEGVATGGALAGCVKSDKAVILGKEFDLLFGYVAPKSEPRSEQPRREDAELRGIFRHARASGYDSDDMLTGEL